MEINFTDISKVTNHLPVKEPMTQSEELDQQFKRLVFTHVPNPAAHKHFMDLFDQAISSAKEEERNKLEPIRFYLSEIIDSLERGQPVDRDVSEAKIYLGKIQEERIVDLLKDN